MLDAIRNALPKEVIIDLNALHPRHWFDRTPNSPRFIVTENTTQYLSERAMQNQPIPFPSTALQSTGGLFGLKGIPVEKKEEPALTIVAVPMVSEENPQPTAQVFHFTPDAVRNDPPTDEEIMFTRRYDETERVVLFNPKWRTEHANYAGIFNSDASVRMVFAPFAPAPTDTTVYLKPGEMAKFMDNEGRRVILVGTRLGPVAVYERKNRADVRAVITFTAPPEVEQTTLLGFGNSILKDQFLINALGDVDQPNIGETIDNIYTVALDFTCKNSLGTEVDVRSKTQVDVPKHD